MAENNNFDGTVQSLFKGMSNLLTTKTVVGEAVNIDDTIILPLVDVSFGMGAGSRKDNAKDTSQGGVGVKMSPSAVLVIHNGTSRLVNIKNQDTVTKIVDMIPELVDRFKTNSENSKSKSSEMTDEEIIDAASKGQKEN
ncbi:MAG: GerW family sporulation protein [Lachnospiraceae bacterium]|nr:GerW family sporulation protein [Lachnospiraceae bacterium]